MKQITIKSIRFTNFRGFQSYHVNFDSSQTTISGANSMGKSTIFNGFMWLLFGKDSSDRKDFNIKRIVDGNPLTKTECSVEGVFYIDEEGPIVLRRSFVEDWVKPRGQVEQVYKGNHTETSWNGVPLNVSEYQSRINAIIGDSVFKMVTNPLFFVGMKWQDQREQLFQLAGSITDVDIARGNPNYTMLLDRISGKSLADFKKELSSRKKKLQAELAQVQPRIDQTQVLMPKQSDFAQLEVVIGELTRQIADVDAAIADRAKAIRQQYAAVREQQETINGYKQQQQQILYKEKEKAQKAVYEANGKRREVEAAIAGLNSDKDSQLRAIEGYNRELATLNNKLSSKQEAIEHTRQQWFSENAVEYNGDDTCHACGQPLPIALKDKAHRLFDEAKQKKLAEITHLGKDLGDEICVINQDIEAVSNSLKTAKIGAKDMASKIEAETAKLTTLKEVEQAEIDPSGIPQYSMLSKKIAEIEAKPIEATDNIDTTTLQSQRKALQQQLDTTQKELSNRELIAKYRAEIASLESHGKDIAQQIAEVEREEYTVQQYTRAKVDECERRINGLFTMVKFRLFDHTIEGNEVETCEALVNGIPFSVANSAGRIWAGLDIIRALQRFYGVCAPIFIDSAEGVNKFPPMDNQMVLLRVTEDKGLKVSNG